MKIKFLLLGTSLSLIPTITFAQCVATQDCASLGYTETSCNGGKGIKCPFGNLWACLTSEEECLNLACDKLGFSYTCTGTGGKGVGNACNGKYQGCSCDSPYTWSGSACTCPSNYKYTCSGTGYSGGAGTACGGKYAACTCSSPYSWSGSTCTCPSNYTYTCSGTGYSGGSGTACGGKYVACTCAIGYEWKDGSCQEILNGAQGELYYCNGTVVGVKATGMNFYVAMQDLGQMTWDDANSQCSSYVFCGTAKGTLPSYNQLGTIYNKKSSINSLLSTNGGTQLTNDYYWSSTYYGYFTYYVVKMSGDGGVSNLDASRDLYVRPVLTSW